jgi:hypothetical protein
MGIRLYIPYRWSEKGKGMMVLMPITENTTNVISKYINTIVMFRAQFFPFQRPKPKAMETVAKGVPTINSIRPSTHQSPNNQKLATEMTSKTAPYEIIRIDRTEMPIGLFLCNEPKINNLTV